MCVCVYTRRGGIFVIKTFRAKKKSQLYWRDTKKNNEQTKTMCIKIEMIKRAKNKMREKKKLYVQAVFN